jgi:hypothetical protein
LTSIVFSRTMFVFFDDPEGPNLLVVTVAAAVVYFLSLAAYSYLFNPFTGLKKLLLTIFSQAIIVTCFYLLLR